MVDETQLMYVTKRIESTCPEKVKVVEYPTKQAQLTEKHTKTNIGKNQLLIPINLKEKVISNFTVSYSSKLSSYMPIY